MDARKKKKKLREREREVTYRIEEKCQIYHNMIRIIRVKIKEDKMIDKE